MFPLAYIVTPQTAVIVSWPVLRFTIGRVRSAVANTIRPVICVGRRSFVIIFLEFT